MIPWCSLAAHGNFKKRWEPEYSGIGRRRSSLNYYFKKSTEQKTQQLCNANRPNSFIQKWLNKLLYS